MRTSKTLKDPTFNIYRRGGSVEKAMESKGDGKAKKELMQLAKDEKDILFDHSGDKLHITLDNEIGWNDTLNVRIDYTSFPKVGAFFVSPDETYPDKPWQAWTQGEDTDNHHWVPMYDYPNERNTFEILLTVDKKFKA